MDHTRYVVFSGRVVNLSNPEGINQYTKQQRESQGFRFEPVTGEWRDRVDEDDKVMVFHPNFKSGKTPYLTHANEEGLLKVMNKSGQTDAIANKLPRQQKSVGPQRTDVKHGDVVARQVLIGDRVGTLHGVVEKAANGQLHVRTKAQDNPVWVGGHIPSKRVKLTDEWQKQ